VKQKPKVVAAVVVVYSPSSRNEVVSVSRYRVPDIGLARRNLVPTSYQGNLETAIRRQAMLAAATLDVETLSSLTRINCVRFPVESARS